VSDTIFGKIIRGEIPGKFIYEDEHCVAINDIHPQAPVHVLVIPRRGIARLVDADQDDQALLGHLLLVADAFRLIINNGAGAGQTVFHLHLHIIAGRTFAEGHMAG
jgi:histidine triad (HIT) family protein